MPCDAPLTRHLLKYPNKPSAKLIWSRHRVCGTYVSFITGHGEIVKMLLTAGAKPEVANEGGETAFDLAKVKGHSEIADILGGS